MFVILLNALKSEKPATSGSSANWSGLLGKIVLLCTNVRVKKMISNIIVCEGYERYNAIFSVIGRFGFDSEGMIRKVLCSYLTGINFRTGFNNTVWGGERKKHICHIFSSYYYHNVEKVRGADSLQWRGLLIASQYL